jgi:parallel beta-helix repeat protein
MFILEGFLAFALFQIPQPPQFTAQTAPISQFGAKGDGKTDDTKAFTAALASNKRIQIDNKIYLLTDTLKMRNASIEGSGTLLFTSQRPIDGIVISGSAELKSLSIRGTGNSLAHAITVSGSNVVLDGVKVSGIHGAGKEPTSGVFLSKVDGVWITNCSFTDIGLDSQNPSFVIWNYYKSQSQHVYIDHNQISGNTANVAIGLFDTSHSTVSNNTIDGGNNCLKNCVNSGYGILFYRTYYGPRPPPEDESVPKLTDETVTNNHISNTAGNGIYLQGVGDSKIIGNSMTNTTLRFNDITLAGSAIVLSYADNIEVKNNIVQHDAKGGICLAYTKNITIEDNQIHGASQWDIRKRVAQVNTTIRNNSVDGKARIQEDRPH